ncbi:hypothetical protein AV530_020113 [Patagioenas fasciata monilis]|uniref:Uncharacterized protein n=1 Tax=Patagioenas fasciata monilis TaxID=372326 RepID=A0A1V4JI55_PATFA|nr:hypothetical protein AV530_020113 [Patagioenas fasciata monilis]
MMLLITSEKPFRATCGSPGLQSSAQTAAAKSHSLRRRKQNGASSPDLESQIQQDQIQGAVERRLKTTVLPPAGLKNFHQICSSFLP